MESETASETLIPCELKPKEIQSLLLVYDTDMGEDIIDYEESMAMVARLREALQKAEVKK